MFYYFLPNSTIQKHKSNTPWGDWVDEGVCNSAVLYKYQLINEEFKFIERQVVWSYKPNCNLSLKPYNYRNIETKN